MFTGIIEELGTIVDFTVTTDAARLHVTAPLAASDAHHGDSIAIAGVCLTVIDQGTDWFIADVMAETLEVSTIRKLAAGDRVNVERSTPAGGRLGGHLVQGHVDGTATLLSREEGSAWRVLRFTLPRDLAPLVAHKGSITVDGVSLTIGAVSSAAEKEPWFEVSLIPETLTATTLGALEVGGTVNLETDMVARQVERLLSFAVTPNATTDRSSS